MKKSLLGIFLLLVLTSCQKNYQCVCTSVSSGEMVLGNNYEATILKKNAAEQACKTNNNKIDTTITNCHIQ